MKFRVTCRYDPGSGHGLVPVEDLIAAGCRFLGALKPYSVNQAAASLDQLAQLHASHWGDAALASLPWLGSRLAKMGENYVSPGVLQGMLDGPRGEPLPAQLRDAKRLQRGVKVLESRTADNHPCLVHGDAHAGNVYETAAARPGLIDWQLVQRGSWGLDVAYHVGATLATSERERSERSLLDHYLERLRAYGAPPPPREAAWLQYRACLSYGYYLWAMTRKVEENITHEFVRRLGLAVAAHDSFGLLDV